MSEPKNKLASWVPGADGSGFSLSNLCYGVAKVGDGSSVVVAIGPYALNLGSCATAGLLDAIDISQNVWSSPSLNMFLGLDRSKHAAVRVRLRDLLSDAVWREAVEPYLTRVDQLTLMPPVKPGDFVDFYASLHHAKRSMKAFGATDGPGENWYAMPIGYHSRTGTIVGSGAQIRRPRGQVAKKTGAILSKTQSLDFEVEIGFVICGSKELGDSVSVGEFAGNVFGLVLLNDWSARDIQAWEGKPLGPLLGKSFATQIGSWVVPLEALDAARHSTPAQHSALEYLRHDEDWGFDIRLTVGLQTSDMVSKAQPPAMITDTNMKHMHWSGAQMLAHMTVNGASVRPGDLFGSGTVSGPELESAGCLLERTNAGRDPIALSNGEVRGWVEDGDRLIIEGRAFASNGDHVSLGQLWGEVCE
ncbi:MAG: fumarylacetoacetate hydrolase family protein [Parvibaculum sp.]|nr:fumarylacetoacetate hydrolase family protein [Parvibaculum sp.]|tara:strand:+ start:1842 stop:3092 length:1251 start_codon:yes stop_codon:yes gene_type:complete